MGGDITWSLQLLEDGLCELLAELHSARQVSLRALGEVFLYVPPLVERVDVPDDALHKDLVLIHGN